MGARLPDPSTGAWQVSDQGGHSPLWGDDGTLYFMGPDSLMSATVQTAGTFALRGVEALFPLVGYDRQIGYTPYDLHRDRDRFVMIVRESARTAPILVVVNWAEELKRLAPN